MRSTSVITVLGVAACLATVPGSSAQSTASAQLVGLVYDKQSRPGDPVTVSMTTDPAKYAHDPNLGVVTMSAAGGTLDGLVVDLGDGHRQPANQPLRIVLPAGAAALPVLLLSSNGNLVARTTMPLASGTPAAATPNTGKAADFSTPPVVQDIGVVNGPFSGDAQTGRVLVDGQPAPVIAETPRAVHFNLPQGTAAGPHMLTVEEGARQAMFPIHAMGLAMQANRLTLLRGQETTFRATVTLGQLPHSIWQGVDGQPGAIRLNIENASPGTVRMGPSRNQAVSLLLREQDLQTGSYTYSGTIQSKKTGSFALNGQADSLLAPIAGLEMAQRSDATPPIFATATTTHDPKTGAVTLTDPATGTTITVDPKKGTTTVKDNKTGASATAPHTNPKPPVKPATPPAAPPKPAPGAPKVDVKLDTTKNEDGSTTTTATITVTANGQTTTITVTTTDPAPDNPNGGTSTTVHDPSDPGSKTTVKTGGGEPPKTTVSTGKVSCEISTDAQKVVHLVCKNEQGQVTSETTYPPGTKFTTGPDGIPHANPPDPPSTGTSGDGAGDGSKTGENTDQGDKGSQPDKGSQGDKGDKTDKSGKTDNPPHHRK